MNTTAVKALSLDRAACVVNHPDGTSTTYRAAANTDAAAGAAIVAARTAAISGDLIEVHRSAAISANLAKAGVNWWFAPGTVITLADDVGTDSVWSDGGAAMQFTVGGYGSFIRSTADDFLDATCILCSHASSRMNINADQISSVSGSDGNGFGVSCEAGVLDVTANNIDCTGGNAYAVWWGNGEMRVRARRISAEYIAVVAGCSATPTGDMHVEAEEIYGPVGADAGNSNVNAAVWIRANIIKPSAAPTNPSVLNQGAGKVYVEAQKLFGPVNCSAGLTYVRTDKIAAIINGVTGFAALTHVSGGTLRLVAGHLDPVTFTGEMIKVTGGELQMNDSAYVGNASSNGMEVTGGTVRLSDVRLDTSAASAKNPITKSGGTLAVSGCVLVAEGTRDSIAAGTPQNVKVFSASVANRAPNANVTIQAGTLTVSTDVA